MTNRFLPPAPYHTHTHTGTFYDMIGLAKADQAAHHDYHHTVNTGNFGVEWLDWLLGTEDG